MSDIKNINIAPHGAQQPVREDSSDYDGSNDDEPVAHPITPVEDSDATKAEAAREENGKDDTKSLTSTEILSQDPLYYVLSQFLISTSTSKNLVEVLEELIDVLKSNPSVCQVVGRT